MSQELFFEGYSEYELEALKIPLESNKKCLKQYVDYTRCNHKAGVTQGIFSDPCEDTRARYERCQQKSVNYYTGGPVGSMLFNNPSLFREKNVSETYENNFPSPTIFSFSG